MTQETEKIVLTYFFQCQYSTYDRYPATTAFILENMLITLIFDNKECNDFQFRPHNETPILSVNKYI